MRVLIVAAFAVAFGAGAALAEGGCAWMQTAAKSSVVAKSEQAATPAQTKRPQS